MTLSCITGAPGSNLGRVCFLNASEFHILREAKPASPQKILPVVHELRFNYVCFQIERKSPSSL
jgi:hypothetical protein